MAHLDSDVEITEKDVREALKQPSDFGHHSDLPLFETWSLGPVILSRDSKLLEQSNHDALIRHLESDPSLADDWQILTVNHWAVGWVEHLAFRAVDDHGAPTRMMRVVKDWFDHLADYPVADDSDYSEKEYEATLKNIEDVGSRFVKSRAPKNWPSKVFKWFWDNDESAVENRNGDGGYPSDEQMKAALRALKLMGREYSRNTSYHGCETAAAQQYAADVAKALHRIRGYGRGLHPEKIPRSEVDAVYALMSKYDYIYSRGFSRGTSPVHVAQEIQNREWDGR